MTEASCHCAAIRLQADAKPTELTQCTCSICRRYAALWFYLTRETARVVQGAEQLTRYSWDEKSIAFCHCSICGCLTHYESTEKSANSRIAINARMMAPEDVENVRVRTFDGAATWKYLD